MVSPPRHGIFHPAGKLSVRSLILVLVLALLVSCSSYRRGGYYKDDGPPKGDKVDIASIPDAVPEKAKLSSSGNKPYRVLGKTYYPLSSAANFRQKGIASWYGKKFHGRRTSSGETYDMYAMTAAHPVLPLPTWVMVRNLDNGKKVVVKVNDRGPFLHNRIIDLSYAAASKLGVVARGTAAVEVVALQPDSAMTENGPGAPVADARAEAVIPPAGQARMYIQVGAFSARENAEQISRKLAASGYGPVLIERLQRQSGLLFRVRIGPLKNVKQADDYILRLSRSMVEMPRLVFE